MIPRSFLDRVAEKESWEALASALPPGANSLPLFKVLALQQWLHLSDDELVAEIEDRASLRRFCGFHADESLTAAVAVREFRQQLGPGGSAALDAFLRRWPLHGAPPPLLSVVSPVYCAEEIVGEFVRNVRDVLEKITPAYEIILVEDGSDDGTWKHVEATCASDSRVKGVKLTRNFGQHQAITAGLEHARGEFVVVMDCDLQDDPAFIPSLYEKAREGHDVVLTARGDRAHGWIKNIFARFFASVLNDLAGGIPADAQVGGYSILSRRAVNAFRGVGDVHRHYLVIVRWLGFPIAHVPVVHRPRYRGNSSYSFWKLARHAIDGWISHSNRLLYTSVAMGFTFLFGSIAGTVLVVVLYFVQGFAQGWPSIVVLILICTGAILVSLGVLGIYVGKIFDQVRARPLYVVERTVNAADDAPSR
ncbi:MAG TPA: glycosyltransferase [Thermoanaerobaculia bacterium]|nr:glycosyltransferase [Thermoanaerobaculia bacterium]